MDPIGTALYNYHFSGDSATIHVDSNYTEDEEIDPAWFFRTYPEMPELEKVAVDLCRGIILDVGAGAGCHALELQNRGLRVWALEQSRLACRVMKDRGILNLIQEDLFTFNEGRYDTIILLMNGAGIAGTLSGLKKLLLHLKALLQVNGQIILDSSDINYLFEEEDGSVWIDLANDQYYGEMIYTVKYKAHTKTFPWLFVDFETLSVVALAAGLKAEKVTDGESNDFLARLTV
jgi:hypothetical protein